ncbi:hypothetical protein ElP_68900 [Tautonia plasticadhaerens]|uniref:Uncharacterized protein n=1 Tax=Tautonia plasticadhaerens TaxID=2527974 RepID=A0A518HDM2_9BACT|nr:hypothetical protein ElP_68900 [Tautonia plasticadhaerens]
MTRVPGRRACPAPAAPPVTRRSSRNGRSVQDLDGRPQAGGGGSRAPILRVGHPSPSRILLPHGPIAIDPDPPLTRAGSPLDPLTSAGGKPVDGASRRRVWRPHRRHPHSPSRFPTQFPPGPCRRARRRRRRVFPRGGRTFGLLKFLPQNDLWVTLSERERREAASPEKKNIFSLLYVIKDGKVQVIRQRTVSVWSEHGKSIRQGRPGRTRSHPVVRDTLGRIEFGGGSPRPTGASRSGPEAATRPGLPAEAAAPPTSGGGPGRGGGVRAATGQPSPISASMTPFAKES